MYVSSNERIKFSKSGRNSERPTEPQMKQMVVISVATCLSPGLIPALQVFPKYSSEHANFLPQKLKVTHQLLSGDKYASLLTPMKSHHYINVHLSGN